jgi:putative oligomerization/nucleic acid binding protein
MAKPLTDEDLQVNQQAASVAATVLSQPVVAAARFEQVSMDMAAEAAGVGAMNRGMMKGMMKVNKLSSVGRMADGMKGGGLPGSFIIAVTADQVVAIEDKRSGGQLVAGDVIKSWDRQGLLVKRGAAMAAGFQGIPDDRQEVVFFLPMGQDTNNKYLKAAGANIAAAGSPGMPTKFMTAKDGPSEAVLTEIASKAAPTVMIGGQIVSGPGMPQAAPADPMERLSKAAELHAKGILTDDEFAAQKAAILGG